MYLYLRPLIDTLQRVRVFEYVPASITRLQAATRASLPARLLPCYHKHVALWMS